MEEKGIKQRGMEEAPENSKESSHSAHANGMNECNRTSLFMVFVFFVNWQQNRPEADVSHCNSP